jgi:hypothetical protein
VLPHLICALVLMPMLESEPASLLFDGSLGPPATPGPPLELAPASLLLAGAVPVETLSLLLLLPPPAVSPAPPPFASAATVSVLPPQPMRVAAEYVVSSSAESANSLFISRSFFEAIADSSRAHHEELVSHCVISFHTPVSTSHARTVRLALRAFELTHHIAQSAEQARANRPSVSVHEQYHAGGPMPILWLAKQAQVGVARHSLGSGAQLKALWHPLSSVLSTQYSVAPSQVSSGPHLIGAPGFPPVPMPESAPASPEVVPVLVVPTPALVLMPMLESEPASLLFDGSLGPPATPGLPLELAPGRELLPVSLLPPPPFASAATVSVLPPQPMRVAAEYVVNSSAECANSFFISRSFFEAIADSSRAHHEISAGCRRAEPRRTL